MGQSAEHERITRRALSCDANRECLQPLTLDELAGKRGGFGAVGYPDGSTLALEARAHCDNGDYLDTPGYPQSETDAQAALTGCRDWMGRHLESAVNAAAGLLDAQGRVRPEQVTLRCTWIGGVRGRAKCNVLQDFGIVLHAAQDFYSHSNWTDVAIGPTGPLNPPGLGHEGPSPFIALRRDLAAPVGLITGCFAIPETRCGARVTHEVLNKDEGPIAAAVGPGRTPRGRENGNFARAVDAATVDTMDKWALLQERLIARYGPERGGRMICAIATDDPVAACP
jgi:hypothetical protein